ncbi:MAG: hypothetical protein KME40_17525 [Komarekiella atlantica HA4396-MV6]|jgi:hypothetical protein|nr:hypothetical protein [Komarekiella atlantica HA4396-MV6]
MLSILETLIFLFGTAFILGFLTYGLIDNTNPPKKDDKSPAPIPPVVDSPTAEKAEPVSS